MKQSEIILPIVYGSKQNYRSLEMKDARTIYICVDTGNMYLGIAPIGKDVIFRKERNIPADVGDNGEYCISPYGVYYKEDDTWKLFSLWHVDDNNNLIVNGNIVPVFDIATTTKAGVVLSTTGEDGTIAVDADGKMTVNGWTELNAKLKISRVDEG